ncbi:hypothetical protein ACFV28_13060 [Streptomyces sp. NPDC059720]|uniref:hypothetical protein n=1 Tax=Streptomyces sp. NPDC059720 TaxID=3346924 RepID=UPI0036930E6B
MTDHEAPHADPHRTSGASDAELVTYLTLGAPSASHALQVLRSRHSSALLHYARLCAADERFALQLCRQTISTAAQAAVAGRVESRAVRHSLLLLVQNLAAEWNFDERQQRLDPAFTRWLREFGDEHTWQPVHHRGAGNHLLRAYWQLPQMQQEILWHGEVEVSGRELACACAGITVADFEYQRDQALTALRRGYLETYGAGCGDSDCRGYVRILDAQARSSVPGTSPEFDAHRADCAGCDHALTELTTLYEAPRLALIPALIGYAGTRYIGRRATPVPAVAAEPDAVVRPSSPRRPRLVVPVTITVAAATLVVGAALSLRASERPPAESGERPPSATTSQVPEPSPPPSSGPPSSTRPTETERTVPSRRAPVTSATSRRPPTPSDGPSRKASRTAEPKPEPTAVCTTYSSSSGNGGQSNTVVIEADGGVSISSQQISGSGGGKSVSVVIRCTGSGGDE